MRVLKLPMKKLKIIWHLNFFFLTIYFYINYNLYILIINLINKYFERILFTFPFGIIYHLIDNIYIIIVII